MKILFFSFRAFALVTVTMILPTTAGLLFAQDQAPIQNPQNTLQQVNSAELAPSSDDKVASLTTGQNDDLAGLDVVKTYPVPQTLTLSTDQNIFWTDNAFLTKQAQTGSFGYNGRLRISYVPYSTRDWTPTISFEQQFIRYDHTSILDFNAQTVQLNSHYDIFKDKSFSWDSSYSLQRLFTEKEHQGEFYKESFLDNTLTYVHPLMKDSNNLFLLASYEIGWRLTDPARYERIDNALLASVIYLIAPEMRVQAYIRPAIYAYTNDEEIDFNTGELHSRSRTDYNLSTGVNFSYSPIKWVTLNANLNWTGNYSNVGFREYTALTPGLSASGAIGFW